MFYVQMWKLIYIIIHSEWSFEWIFMKESTWATLDLDIIIYRPFNFDNICDLPYRLILYCINVQKQNIYMNMLHVQYLFFS